MKIWLVTKNDWDTVDIIAAFDSEALAKGWVSIQPDGGHYIDIREMTVNAIPEQHQGLPADPRPQPAKDWYTETSELTNHAIEILTKQGERP